MSQAVFLVLLASDSLEVSLKNDHHILWVNVECSQCDSVELWYNDELVGFGANKFALPRLGGNRFKIKVLGVKKGQVLLWEADTIIQRKNPYDGASPVVKETLDSLNALRVRLSLPVVSLDSSLWAAAQSHASYLAANWKHYEGKGLSMHEETKDKAGFTGKHCWNRAEHFGYPKELFVTEVIAFALNHVLSIQGWTNTLYHRLPLLDPDVVEMGFGFADPESEYQLLAFDKDKQDYRRYYGIQVMNPGGYELNWPINKPFFVCYPYPDQKNVPTSMKPEIPDPAPDIPEEGFPITVQFPSCYTKWLRVINISLYDENLEEVKTRFLFSGNDRMLNQNEYACLPEKPLKKRTKYKVVLNYTWRESSGVLSWEFMTRDGWW